MFIRVLAPLQAVSRELSNLRSSCLQVRSLFQFLLTFRDSEDLSFLRLDLYFTLWLYYIPFAQTPVTKHLSKCSMLLITVIMASWGDNLVWWIFHSFLPNCIFFLFLLLEKLWVRQSFMNISLFKFFFLCFNKTRLWFRVFFQVVRMILA